MAHRPRFPMERVSAFNASTSKFTHKVIVPTCGTLLKRGRYKNWFSGKRPWKKKCVQLKPFLNRRGKLAWKLEWADSASHTMKTVIEDLSNYSVQIYDGGHPSRMYRCYDGEEEEPPRAFVIDIIRTDKTDTGRSGATLQARDHSTLMRWCKAFGIYATTTTNVQRLGINGTPSSAPPAATAAAKTSEPSATQRAAAAAAAARRKRAEEMQRFRALAEDERRRAAILREMNPLSIARPQQSARFGKKSERVAPSPRPSIDTPSKRAFDVDAPVLSLRSSASADRVAAAAVAAVLDSNAVRSALRSSHTRRMRAERRISRDMTSASSNDVASRVHLAEGPVALEEDDDDDDDDLAGKRSHPSPLQRIRKLASRGKRQRAAGRYRSLSWERPATNVRNLGKKRSDGKGETKTAFGDIDDAEVEMRDPIFRDGETVVVGGLRKNVEFNGRRGTVVKFVAKDNLYVVRIFKTENREADEIVLSPMNLSAAPTDDDEAGEIETDTWRGFRREPRRNPRPSRDRPTIDRGYGIKKIDSLEWLRRLRLVRKTLDARVYGHAHMVY